ncbi:ester cyclase [Nocardia brasiliensis]
MTTAAQQRPPDRSALIAEFFRRLDAHDFDWARAQLTDSCRLVAPGFDQTGAEIVVQWIAGFVAAFPDMRHRVHQISSGADHCAFLVAVTGTHAGELVLADGTVVAATGRPLAITLGEFWTFTGAQVSEYRVLYDGLDFAERIGLLSGSAETSR